MTLQFLASDYDALTVSVGGQVVRSPAPRGIWLWIVVWRNKDSFGVQVDDILGRNYWDGSEQFSIVGEESVAEDTVKIASSFNGFIKGLKYHKVVYSRFGAERFVEAPLTQESLLMYFNFEPGSLLGENKFKNLRERYDTDFYGLSISGAPHFDGVAWFQIGSRLTFGTLRTAIGWDGISCKSLNPFDIGLMLYFDDETGYASSEFQLLRASGD